MKVGSIVNISKEHTALILRLKFTSTLKIEAIFFAKYHQIANQHLVKLSDM
jgi:hypothetical protein